ARSSIVLSAPACRSAIHRAAIACRTRSRIMACSSLIALVSTRRDREVSTSTAGIDVGADAFPRQMDDGIEGGQPGETIFRPRLVFAAEEECLHRTNRALATRFLLQLLGK